MNLQLWVVNMVSKFYMKYLMKLMSIYKKFLEKLNSSSNLLLVFLTIVLLVVTVVYISDARYYASESERYASQTSQQFENITKISENIHALDAEILYFYQNPQPILTNWTNKGKFNYLTIETYEKWGEMIEFYKPYEYKSLSEFVTEITIYLWNAGSAPARCLLLDIIFEIDGYNYTNPAYPYPIKIYSVTTPTDYLGYISILHNEFVNATTHGGGIIYANSDGRIEFLPEIENKTKEIQYPSNIDLGNIVPNDITSFSIKLFAMNKDTQGKMILIIKDVDNKEQQRITIPVKTYE